MDCPACRAQNPESHRFCGDCGAALERACPSCGRTAAAGQRFCGSCGAALDAANDAGEARKPRDYTPPHLAEKILTQHAALEGERKQVTVLFADVKGSVALSEQVDAEEWHGILDRFFRILADGVHRFEGTINQYTGDGVMALFGAPLAHEDHAQRACYAALQLTEKLRAYADSLRRERGLSFATRLALNTGEVVVGKIGDDLRMDYTAQGATVGVAARVQELAEPGRVYVAEPTARLVEGWFELRDLGRFDLRGVSDPLRVFELQRASGLRTRLQVARRRGLSPFVARRRELDALENALAQAREGNGQVVSVVGEAGVGKSRLCFEFVESARGRGVPVHEAHCPPHGKAVPLVPIQELMRRSLGVASDDDPRAARERIAGRLLLLDPDFRDDLPLVFEFLDVPDPEAKRPLIDPENRRRRLLSVVRRTFQARSERETAVLFVDDLHWIDPASDAVLTQLVDVVAGSRTLLLVNFRPEYVPAWRARSHFLQLPLAPLGDAAIDDLLGALLGDDAGVATLAKQIRERVGGSPFFAEELVQSLVEAGTLEGSRGAYRVAREPGDLGLPDTVQSVLAARIDRLPGSARRVLRTAAVIGPHFAESLLARVCELPESELSAALSKLEATEFVFAERLHPEPEYAFKHPLTQEVAYESQLKADRSRLHRAVAEALHGGSRDLPTPACALLAHHWEAAGEPLEAARWHGHAGRQIAAGRGGAAAESVRHWLHAKRLADSAPPTPRSLALRVWTAAQALGGSSALSAGRILSDADQDALYADALQLGERLGDEGLLSMLAGARGQVAVQRGEIHAGLGFHRESVRLIDAAGRRGGRFLARANLVRALRDTGQLAESERWIDEVLAEFGDADTDLGRGEVGVSPLLAILVTRMSVQAMRGRLSEAEETAERFLAAYSGTGMWMPAFHMLRAEHYYLGGDAAACRRIATQHTSDYGAEDLLPTLTALADMLEDRWEGVRERLDRKLTLSGSGLYYHSRSRFGSRCALAALRTGDTAWAETRAREELAEALRTEVAMGEIEPRLVLARIGIETGAERDAIESELARAEACIEESDARVYAPWVHEIRAGHFAARGDPAARERELRAALRLYTSMNATGRAQRISLEMEASRV